MTARYEVRIQLVVKSSLSEGNEVVLDQHTFEPVEGYDRAQKLFSSIITPKVITHVYGGVVVDSTSNHPNQVVEIRDHDIEDERYTN